MALIDVEHVSKAFGGVQALTDCSLAVEEGTITGLIGPNGSGKTTLFNVITGYTAPDAGTIRFRGRPLGRITPDQAFSWGIGRTFQLTRIFPRLTVLENMYVPAQRTGIRGLLTGMSNPREHRRAMDLLAFVGLEGQAGDPAGSLSYGQRKLLEFAQILVADPRVILLDEPAGGVNPTMLQKMERLIRDVNRQGVTFLIVEHNMGFVMGLSDHVIVMHRGTTIASGQPEAVRQNPLVLDAYLGD
jgi:ABC-type branched-subunit amino acid transport system ATPase component